MMRAPPLLVLALAIGLFACEQPASHAQVPAATDTSTNTSGAAPPALAPMLARVSPAVVNISVQGTVRVQQSPLFRDPLFQYFFGLPRNQAPPTERFQAAGSGVIIDAANGYVITNNHVVDHADRIQVTLTDRRQLEAKLVGTDPQTDVAVLKIDADRLTALPMGSSANLQVGNYVVAIGNPFGVGQTATFGIVSALGRSGLGIEGYEDFIQTDASINPGNSGGALVDTDGQLIGINTAILSRSGGNVGIGFAVPIDMARSVAQQLIDHGKVERGALGVTVQDLTPSLALAMGLDVSNGALVSQVMPQSAAAKAGIRDGDVVTAMDGQPITTSSQLRNAVGQKRPGDSVRFTLLRDGKERTVMATLDPLQSRAASESPARAPESEPLYGLTVAPIPNDDPNFGKVKGVYVASVEPESVADAAGIQQGDIILSAARMPVSTPAEFARIVRNEKKGTPLLLQVRRGDATIYVAVG